MQTLLTFCKSMASKQTLDFFRRIRTILYRFTEKFSPFLTSRRYLGKRLFYIKGPGIVDRIRFGAPSPYYEHEVHIALKKEIEAIKNKTGKVILFDVGANIGLVSLPLTDIPNLTIHAFEPGHKQFAVLQTNIAANKLFGRLFAYPIALSNTTGIIDFFSTQDGSDGCGDGLRTTPRGKNTFIYRVETETLDSWCQRHSIYPDIIKLDTEGAESLILNGAKDVLSEKRPVLFIEISPSNLEAYSLTTEDMFRKLTQLNYVITTISGDICTESNIQIHAELDDMFIAMPGQ